MVVMLALKLTLGTPRSVNTVEWQDALCWGANSVLYCLDLLGY